MKHWIGLIMILPFAVTLGCGGGGGGNHQTAAVNTGTGAIEGYVFVPATSSNTASAKSVSPMITLDCGQTPPLGYVALVGADIVIEANGQTVKTKTDTTGHFKVEGLPSGTAKVTITPPLIGNTGLGEFFTFTTTMEVKDKTTAYIGSNGNISLISHSADHLGVVINQITNSQPPTLDLYISVIDPARNTPIIGLGPQNFEVKMAGTVVNVTNVQQVESSSAPISVCLVLDRSGSMDGQPFYDAQTAAKQFVNCLGPSDSSEIISFSDEPTIDCAFTGNKSQLNSVIDQLISGGATALYDAVGLGIDDVSRQSNVRKAVVILTDGGENSSYNFDLARCVSNAKSTGIPIYTIGLAGSDFTTRSGSNRAVRQSVEHISRPSAAAQSRTSSEEDLQQLASETGGEYFYAPDSSDLMGIYTKVSQRQQQMYIVTVTDPNPQTNNRTVEIRVSACGLSGTATASYRISQDCDPDPNRSWDPAAGLQKYTDCTGRPVYHYPNYYDGIGNTGQCTWFVYAVRQDELPTPGQGDAYKWYEVCQNAGYNVGSLPKPGSVAVWNENIAGTGHIALVTNVITDNSFEVWDSNWSPGLDQRVRHRTVTNPTDFTGFIYWKGSDVGP